MCGIPIYENNTKLIKLTKSPPPHHCSPQKRILRFALKCQRQLATLLDRRLREIFALRTAAVAGRMIDIHRDRYRSTVIDLRLTQRTAIRIGHRAAETLGQLRGIDLVEQSRQPFVLRIGFEEEYLADGILVEELLDDVEDKVEDLGHCGEKWDGLRINFDIKQQ